ncbi:class I SAM-dependent methyltransferase [Phytohabitans rumicis]|uniref:Trans-aconitate methyltransferase n=1 Tax=Phytohabitans rumicis TaxID=1076125 RepID=A0A6V8LQI8_9ACTN|nr:class I SAM-dependent methyltransferase [Phytohabitans rumicis]GFJ94975.1 trans-aconitate methyltransferase [Phytohabitans rumicis]
MAFSPTWLALREPADADARALSLLEPLLGAAPKVIRDLGCGTGSMGRWLAGRLPGPQHWVLYDADPDLLALAAAGLPAGVSVETRQADVTRLTATDLAGADLVTASALLDLLTRAELDRLVEACAGAGCPALLTISVTGRVELTPADPLDASIEAAFNEHQRRRTGGRDLLGPDAVDAAAAAFTRLGMAVRVAPSPWRLGPARADLAAEWLRGWVGAAVEQRPELAGPAAAAYLSRRLADGFAAVVHHSDLLANFE